MTEILKQLQVDHRNMDLLLRKLPELLEQEATSGYLSTADVIHYMTHYPDVAHHPTEDIMFEYLLRRDAALQPIIDKLVAEHKALAETGQILLQIAYNARYDPDTASSLQEGCHGYITSLRDHMSIEEAQIFPHARALLTHHDWVEIAGKRKSFADPLFGDTILKGYEHIYETLMR